MTREADDSALLNTLALAWAKSIRIPMNLIDGRPWVPTAEEADPGPDDPEWEREYGGGPGKPDRMPPPGCPARGGPDHHWRTFRTIRGLRDKCLNCGQARPIEDSEAL